MSDIVLPVTFYHRHSRDNAVKKKVIVDGQAVYEQTDLIGSIRRELNQFIETYRGNCIACHKTITFQVMNDGYYDIDVTGRVSDREELNKLMADAELGLFAMVITLYSSRIGRDVAHTKMIRSNLSDVAVQVLSKYEPVPIQCPDCYDPLNNDSAAIIESNSDLISDMGGRSVRRNYKTGLVSRFLSGRPLLGMPYGLMKRVRVTGQDSRLNDVIDTFYEWDESKTVVVKRIVDEYLGGVGTWDIAKRLNQDGIPSSQGKSWGRTAIINHLQNPIYAGHIRSNWKPAPKIKRGPRSKRVIKPFDEWKFQKSPMVTPLYPWETYLRIIETIKSKAHMGGRAAGSESMLIGILKCGYCGSPMFSGKTTRNRPYGKYTQTNYHCGKFQQTGTCVYNGVAQHIVESAVMDEVMKLFDETTKGAFFEELSKQKHDTIETMIEKNKTTTKAAHLKLKRAEAAYLDGAYTLSAYKELKEKLEKEVIELTAGLKKLESKLASSNEIVSLDDTYRKAVEAFRAADNEQSRKTIKMILLRLIERIDYKGEIGNRSRKTRKRDINIQFKIDFF